MIDELWSEVVVTKGIIDEDFVQYKKCSMVILLPECHINCDNCHNKHLKDAPDVEITVQEILDRYRQNPLSEAIVFSGLEPTQTLFHREGSIERIMRAFHHWGVNVDFVIYTGHNPYERSPNMDTWENLFKVLSEIYPNLIVKWGEYDSKLPSRFDEVLGVTLASDNQYAVKYS